VIAARICASILAFFGLILIVKSMIGVRFLAQLGNLLPIFASGLLMTGAIWLTRMVLETSPQLKIIELLIMGGVGTGVYGVALWVMGALPDFNRLIRRDPATPP
jgi:hypothetical protein